MLNVQGAFVTNTPLSANPSTPGVYDIKGLVMKFLAGIALGETAGQVIRIDMSNQDWPAVANVTGRAAVQAGGNISISVTNLVIPVTSTSSAGLLPVQSSLSITLNITASANVLTDSYPVPLLAVTYNRNATASALARATPGAAAGGAAAAAPSRSATASDATAAGAGSANGSCPISQRFMATASTGTCACASGWFGVGCVTCQADSACQSLVNDTDATCDTTLTASSGHIPYIRSSTCNLTNPDFAAAFKGASVLCSLNGDDLPDWLLPPGSNMSNFPPPVGTAAPAGSPFCLVTVDVAKQPGRPLQCMGSGCNFADGSADTKCSSVSCYCKGGCSADVQGALDVVTGDATFACQNTLPSMGVGSSSSSAAGGLAPRRGEPRNVAQCSLTMNGLPAVLDLACAAGQCSAASLNRNVKLTGGTAAAPDWIPLIAASPLLLDLLLALVATAYLLTHRDLFKQPAAARRAGPGPPPCHDDVGYLDMDDEDTADAGDKDTGEFTSSAAVLSDLSINVDELFQKKVTPAPAAAATVGLAAVTGNVAGRQEPLVFLFENIVCSVPVWPKPGKWNGGTGKHCWNQPHSYIQGCYGWMFAGAAANQGTVARRVTLNNALVNRASTGAGEDVELPGMQYDAQGNKVLLHCITGHASSGEVLGVLGPSGSGKSTLLSILSGTLTDVAANSIIKGRVRLGDVSKPSIMRKFTAYVAQADVLLPSLTVSECLQYSALLRLPQRLPASEVRARIAGVLNELNLTAVAGSLVGCSGSSSIRGVSGGERRRVSIGMELVTKPLLLLMDEPTSGLDSFSALNLVKTCEQVASHGRIIVMSLHQPSPDMLLLLDRVMLLARGHVLYAGPPGGVDAHLAAAGVPRPPRRAIAEHMLVAASKTKYIKMILEYVRNHGRQGSTAESTDSEQGVDGVDRVNAGAISSLGGGQAAVEHQDVEMGGVFDKRTRFRTCQDHVPKNTAPDTAADRVGQDTVSQKDQSSQHAVTWADENAHARGAKGHQKRDSCPEYGSGGKQRRRGGHHGHAGLHHIKHCILRFVRELAVLFKRSVKDMIRTPALLLMHVALAILTGLVVGLIFLNLQADFSGVQNRAGAMFFSLAFFGFTSLTGIDGLVLERNLVIKETRSKYYSLTSYLTTKLVLDALLLRTLPVMLYTALLYPLVGLSPVPSKVATFFCVLSLYSASVGALAVAITALVGSAGAASLLMNLILLLWVLVGGFLVSPQAIPVWIRWLRYCTPLSYAFEAMIGSELQGFSFTFKVAGYPAVPNVKGETALQVLGLDAGRVLQDVVILIVFYVGFIALAFILSSLSTIRWRMQTGRLKKWSEQEPGNTAECADQPAPDAPDFGKGAKATRVPSMFQRGAQPNLDSDLEDTLSMHSEASGLFDRIGDRMHGDADTMGLKHGSYVSTCFPSMKSMSSEMSGDSGTHGNISSTDTATSK
eukprot:jgi/Chrzof1/2225/Cz11g07110.t1